MRQQPIIKMANIDDELSISMGSEDEFESHADKKTSRSTRLNLKGSLESLGFCNEDLARCSKTIDQLDWEDSDSERAYGLSISLYEKHPVTGLHGEYWCSILFVMCCCYISYYLTISFKISDTSLFYN